MLDFPLIVSRARNLGLVITLLGLTACASYPTQEMSDARQAIRAAQDVGAKEQLPDLYQRAAGLLSEAEAQLNTQSPHYSKAKSKALAAKQTAVNARNLTVAISKAETTIAKFYTSDNKLTEAKAALEKAHNAIENNQIDEALKQAELAKNLAIQGR